MNKYRFTLKKIFYKTVSRNSKRLRCLLLFLIFLIASSLLILHLGRKGSSNYQRRNGDVTENKKPNWTTNKSGSKSNNLLTRADNKRSRGNIARNKQQELIRENFMKWRKLREKTEEALEDVDRQDEDVDRQIERILEDYSENFSENFSENNFKKMKNFKENNFPLLNFDSEMLNESMDFINGEMDRILKKYKERSDQNIQFKKMKIPSNLPLKPIRMTLTTAVFKYNINESQSAILKRIILSSQNRISEDKICIKLKDVHRNIVKTYMTTRTYRELPRTENGGEDEGVEKQTLIWIFFEFMDVTVTISGVEKRERIIRNILSDVLLGLKYLHDRGYAHLDIKVMNIMGSMASKKNNERITKIDDSDEIVYKLIDFGYTQYFGRSNCNIELVHRNGDLVAEGNNSSAERNNSSAERNNSDGLRTRRAKNRNMGRIPRKSYGTFPFKAPEVMAENLHGPPSDIWSIGAVAWYLCIGKIPFYNSKLGGKKDTKKYRHFAGILSGSNPTPMKKRFGFFIDTSDELKDFVISCMKIDWKERPTVDQLLNHPFIKKRGNSKSQDFPDAHGRDIKENSSESNSSSLSSSSSELSSSSDRLVDYSTNDVAIGGWGANGHNN